MRFSLFQFITRIESFLTQSRNKEKYIGFKKIQLSSVLRNDEKTIRWVFFSPIYITPVYSRRIKVYMFDLD